MADAETHDQFYLSGAWNFRDVGGLRTADGGTVRAGVLYRSSQLAGLDDAGRQALTGLGVTDVYDLRGTGEVERAGSDALPAGVALHAAPFDPERDDSAPHEAPQLDTPERVDDFMTGVYAQFADHNGAHKAIGDIARSIADSDGAVLVHCAAGKDRAGWVTATLLRAVGVTDDDIVADYLRSNDAVEPLRQMLSAKYGDHGTISDAMLGVTEHFYRAGMKTVDERYGGFDAYLAEIGIDSDTLSRLRRRLLG
ncbi:tyrosine-protein phosphatase [Antrihabitans cavernicola]|uniref:Tyrosine-protein phosphatase n=1 Tax=Antrihabitans cavernicola TaxID=2495913 RepID=A0A5A7SDF5_9NOCA|nr:tyrosine-protein phosphatase [Spelaeibacter cavernicola]KAA0022525.1 tyrosine-protein phosphatase [Spelaeibacter cavernicola]